MKLNLGAGQDIKDGWINHDIVHLDGISVVHDLNSFPWPWEDSSISQIKVYDVLEHLDEFIPSMEELWRILKVGGTLDLSVPYYNSWCAAADPTHKKLFHELTFHFFDPSSPYCQERFYYSKARFKIVRESFIMAPFSPYFSLPGVGEIEVSGKYKKKIIGIVSNYFISNLILDLRLTLEKVKE